MQFLSIAVALAALGFTFTLSRSRGPNERYGIVLIVLPLALATPMVALMASGLQLIYAYRGAASPEGLDALTYGIRRAAETQAIGHVTILALLGALGIIALALALSPPAVDAPRPAASEPGVDEDASKPEPRPRYAIALMVASLLACVAAVATLGSFEDQFIAAPLQFVGELDAGDVSEFSPNRRSADEQRRLGSNALVTETFRALVVVVLFLVLFDAFLVGSRSVTFTRATAWLSIAIIVVAGAISMQALTRHRELRATIDEELRAASQSRAEPDEDDASPQNVLPASDVAPPN